MNYKDHKYKIPPNISNKNFDYILSPSDIGFHNCIKNKKNYSFFILNMQVGMILTNNIQI